jgi:hypothetical protein
MMMILGGDWASNIGTKQHDQAIKKRKPVIVRDIFKGSFQRLNIEKSQKLSIAIPECNQKQGFSRWISKTSL